MELRVLLIGSDREIVNMTGKILRRNLYAVDVAIGPEEALDCLRRAAFDLVLLDQEMNRRDRDRVIQAVKGAPQSPPLLVISGSREDEVPLLKAGADDWIQKPFQMEVLLARMDTLLRRKQTREER